MSSEPWNPSATSTCSAPPATTCGCTSPGCPPTRTTTSRSSSGARAPTSTTPRAGATSTGSPGSSSASSATAAPTSPRPPPSRRPSSPSSRCGPTRTRPRSSSPSGVAGYAPGDLNRVFFTTGGGEAVESAWKLAKNYFKLTGKPLKHKVISRAIAYHGTTQGALSITGLPPLKAAVRAAGALDVPGAEHELLPGARSHGDDLEAFGRWAADQIAVAIENEGPDTVAAVFLEPVQNSGGCFPPPPGYFQRVREICDEYDVLLVSDEVICAFGRLGHMFGAERYGYQPDIITCRQGHHLGLLPARRDDRHRPADGAVPQGRARRSCTATPSAATRSPRRSRWRTSTSSSAEGINQHVLDNEDAFRSRWRS